MANRIVGNTYIIDTASANIALPLGGKFHIESARFWSASTGTALLTGNDTSDVVIPLGTAVNGTTDECVLNGVTFDTLKIPTLSNGTAWLYLA